MTTYPPSPATDEKRAICGQVTAYFFVLAIGTIHIRGRGAGIETDIPAAGIATYREGKLSKWEDFRERRAALKAAGLNE